MFKNSKVAIGVIVGLLVLQVLFEAYKPKSIDWEPDYTQYAKKPYAAYILRRQLSDLFPNQPIKDINTPIYNCLDDILDAYLYEDENGGVPVDSLQYNYIFVNENLSFDSLDINRLLRAVDMGCNVFMAAEDFGKLGDTLKLNMDVNFDNFYLNDTTKKTVALQLLHNDLKDTTYRYKTDQAAYYFLPDSVHNHKVLGINAAKQAVFIKVPFGDGNFWLHSVPIALSNYSLTKDNNAQYASAVLSHLPANRPVLWDEYYKAGRVNNTSPFRYVLSVEPLKWALYLTLVGLLLFMLFEARRKQRIIPIVKPLENTTLEFAKTVGMLYYQTADHKDIAEKKIIYLFDYIRKRFFLQNITYTDTFYQQLAQKSTVGIEQINKLFQQIIAIKTQNSISQEQLLRLNETIDAFYRQTK